MAENAYQSERAQVLAAQEQAAQIGMTAAEFSDLEREQVTTSSLQPPVASPPFNEARISFFDRVMADEAQIKQQLESRIDTVLSQARDSARGDVADLLAKIQMANAVGVDSQLMVDFNGLPSEAQIELADASTISDYRALSTQLKAPLSKLSLLISNQQATNQLISQYTSQIATQDHGDAGLAKSNAQRELTQTQTDLGTARIFQMDVSLISNQVQTLATKLSTASTATALSQIDAELMVQDKVLQDAMTQNLPAKAITISLTQQVLRAYAHGKLVYTTYVTTGRPGLETDPGTFHVYSKTSPFTMHSPWPKGSPYWYPDTVVQTAMWFNGGDAIHDSYWRSIYGPGTEFPHYDPTGEDNGSHGCVNVPPAKMPWLWNWTPVGTLVIVYQG